jgi:hypothetical protein
LCRNWWNEYWQGRETEVLEENLSQRHFVHHISHMTRPGFQTRAAAVGSQRLTASAMARLLHIYKFLILFRLTYKILLFAETGSSCYRITAIRWRITKDRHIFQPVTNLFPCSSLEETLSGGLGVDAIVVSCPLPPRLPSCRGRW